MIKVPAICRRGRRMGNERGEGSGEGSSWSIWDELPDHVRALVETLESRQPKDMVDLVEHSFEARLGPDLIDDVGNAKSFRLDHFLDSYWAYRLCRSQPFLRVPPKNSIHELRPYIPVQEWPSKYLKPAGLMNGMDETVNAWSAQDAAFRYIDRLKLLLLYAHSLAVPNPLRSLLAQRWSLVSITPPHTGLHSLALEDQRSRWVANESIWSSQRRAQLSSYLAFLHDAEPLIRGHVLILVEDPQSGAYGAMDQWLADFEAALDLGYWNVVNSPAFSRWILEQADFADAQDLFSGQAGRRARMIAVRTAIHLVYSTLARSRATNGCLDLYLPYRFFQQTLVGVWRFFTREGIQPVPSVKDHQLKVLADVVSVAVPNLELSELGPRDIVAIRQSSSAFESWRTTLRQTCTRLASGGEAVLDPTDLVRTTVQDEMQEAALQVRESLAREARTRSGVRTLCRFALGGVVAAATGAIAVETAPAVAAGALVAAAGAGLMPLIDYARGAGSTTASLALFRHYLLFAPNLGLQN